MDFANKICYNKLISDLTKTKQQRIPQYVTNKPLGLGNERRE